jgi:hypothetical protein
VQPDISRLHFIGDPGAGTGTYARFRATRYNTAKVGIHGYRKYFFSNGPGQTAWQVKFFGNKDEAWCRAPPEKWFSFRVPGKNTPLVGRDKTFGGEIASNGKQPVRLGKTRIGKEYFMRELKDRHALLSLVHPKISG